MSFKCIQLLPKQSNILYLAETRVRRDTIIEDTKFYQQLYGVDPFEDYNIKYALYQSCWKHDIQYYFPNSESTLIIADEAHEILSDKRILFLKNSNLEGIKLLFLTATINRKTLYNIQGEEITKIKLLEQYAPVVFSYTINDAIDDKNTRDLKFFIISHNLDTRRNLETGTKTKKWMTSELLQYQYLDKEFKKSLFIPLSSENRDFRIRMAASNRARFLYGLPSKTQAVKELVSQIKGKTLVFGQDNNALLEICPTSIVSSNPNLEKDLMDFKEGRTMLTCSNKILKQGENIKRAGLYNLS